MLTELKYQINAERSWAYWGCVKVPIHILIFESNTQLSSCFLDLKNVVRLHWIFQLKECLYLKSEHHVSALIDSQVLTAVLSNAELQSEKLMICDDSSKLNINVSLLCLHRKHWLRAVNEFLDLFNKWWVVDLYLNDSVFHKLRGCSVWTDSFWQILTTTSKQSSERNIWISEIFVMIMSFKPYIFINSIITQLKQANDWLDCLKANTEMSLSYKRWWISPQKWLNLV